MGQAVGANDEKPGTDDLDGAALKMNPGKCTTISAAMDDEEVIRQITEAIKATNNNGSVVISNASKVQKFTILPREFSIETGELTPTFKTKRSVIQKKYEKMIEKIYSGKDVYVKYS